MKVPMMVLGHIKFSYPTVASKTLWIKGRWIPEKASNVFEAFEAVFMEL